MRGLMTGRELKLRAVAAIDAAREELVGIGHDLYAMPETGFREERTSAYVRQALTDCGLEVRDGIALTGLKAKAKGRRHDINVALMGELDALIMPSHADSDPRTGAFHGCGHHAQLTTIIGVAIGLVRSGLIGCLDGDLTFIAVPAEEVIELSYRRELIEAGKIEFVSGKQEFIRLGEFDDIDMVLCSHIMGRTPAPHCWVGHSWNGVLHKTVQFRGRSAHAGLAPDNGINALQAALCAMNNINALRDSLRDTDHVRIHYIITKGGDSANIVPDDVRMEFGVRAATVETMLSVNGRVNAAIRAGAAAVGARVFIDDSAGAYLPCHQSNALGQIYLANAREIIGSADTEDCFGVHRGSSTDCGDVASLLPLLHPYFGGAVGEPHGADFEIVDDEAAYVVPAKLAAATVIDLLSDSAVAAKRIQSDFRPAFAGKDEYLRLFSSLGQECPA